MQTDTPSRDQSHYSVISSNNTKPPTLPPCQVAPVLRPAAARLALRRLKRAHTLALMWSASVTHSSGGRPYQRWQRAAEGVVLCDPLLIPLLRGTMKVSTEHEPSLGHEHQKNQNNPHKSTHTSALFYEGPVSSALSRTPTSPSTSGQGQHMSTHS